MVHDNLCKKGDEAKFIVCWYLLGTAPEGDGRGGEGGLWVCVVGGGRGAWPCGRYSAEMRHGKACT